jgi:hypothetical protein
MDISFDRSRATSYESSLPSSWPARRVRDCVKRAGFKPAVMQRCNTLADRLLFG